MLVIYLALILIFSFIIVQIFMYLRKNLSMMGSVQNKVIQIMVFVIIANLVIMKVKEIERSNRERS
jgi:hypothetical protein